MYSIDLKARVPYMRYSLGYTVKEICGILNLKRLLSMKHYDTIQLTVSATTLTLAGEADDDSSHPSTSLSYAH